jgi:hypothetical protein
MKVVKMHDIELESENEFTKIFVYKENTKLFFSKAYDEETDKHFVVASIPEIAETRTSQISYPFMFDVESDRDEFFQNFNLGSAKEFIEDLIEHIKKQNKINEEKDKEGESDFTEAVVE